MPVGLGPFFQALKQLVAPVRLGVPEKVGLKYEWCPGCGERLDMGNTREVEGNLVHTGCGTKCS